MAFRTLEISNPAEIHVRRGQLEITNEEGIILIPLEDLATIICSGANIRISTMAQAQIAENGISMMIIDEKYHPSCILIPMQSNVRQALVMRNQCAMTAEEKTALEADNHTENREPEVIIDNDKIVGVVVDNRNGNSAPTSVFKIHYAKDGIHISPDYPSKKKRRTK